MSRPAPARHAVLARGACAALLALAAVLAPLAAGALEVPYLSGRVVDEAGMLSPGTVEGLTGILEQLERETGAQVAVLTVPSLEGEAVEDYAQRVAETWRLGRAGEDDGVLLLIARDDRRMRIEVGYGLEGKIPDVLAGRILDNLVRPRFRAGEFDAGIASGVGAVAALIRGEQAEAVVPPSRGSGSRRGVGCAQILLWFIIAFVVLPLIFGRRRRTFRVFGLPIVLGGASRSSGGLGGRSGGSGGFSGGGFSGGGGSFGGGGASSSW